MYTPIYKNGAINGGFIIMAKTETEKSSNYVFCGGPQIDTQTNYDEIFLCSSITPADDCVSSFTGNSDCTYIKSEGQLRYIYKY
ncbi:hypothetical protein KKH82_04060 [Patescibacteria group bacterium]|nr:hypothetical protein [Patescibacteria group bacterium]